MNIPSFVRRAKPFAAALTVLVVTLSPIGANPAQAAIINGSATVDGASSGFFVAGESISATVTVTTTGTGTDNDWRSTSWRIGTGAFICVDTPDNTTAGVHSETFTITAPAVTGVYNAEFIAYNAAGCNSVLGSSSTISLTNGVTVVEPLAETFNVTDDNQFTNTKFVDLPGFDNTDIAGQASGADGTKNGNLANKFAKIGQDEYICATVNASGLASLQLSYAWKGDADTEVSDLGVVEYKLTGGCNDASGWTGVDSHSTNDTSWHSVGPLSLDGSLSNNSFLVRFRNDSSASNEDWRVDDVVITGTAPSGSITIVKDAAPNDPQDFAFTTTGAGLSDFSLDDDADGTLSNSQTFTGLTAGSYSVTETLPAGWVQTSAVCSDGSPVGAIDLSDGEEVTCTFSNRKLGKLTIVKDSIPNDSQDFGFTASGSGLSDFALDDDADGGLPNTQVFGNLATGQYTILETPVIGWDLTNLSCNDDNGLVNLASGSATLNLGVGEEVTCTYTNTKRASFTMTKLTDPAIGSYQFTLDDIELGQEPFVQTFSPEGTWDIENLIPGGYTLSEEVIDLPDTDPEWSREAVCSGIYNDYSGSLASSSLSLTLAPGEAMNCFVNNTQKSVITGKKFEDMDGQGEGATGPVKDGWTINLTQITLDNPDTTETDESAEVLLASDVTDENGDYSFLVMPGMYRVCEVGQIDWYQSYPVMGGDDVTSCGGSNGYQFTVAAGEVKSNLDFGNYQNGTISGTKWNDADADGVIDGDESGLSGWLISIAGPVSGTSFPTVGGVYQFAGALSVPPGIYTLSEIQQPGWAQTFPANNGSHTVTVVSGGAVINKNFGNVQDSTISGSKWEDLDGDGVRDDGENAPSVMFTFELYRVTEDSDSTPIATQTGTSYLFAGLLPGNYKVCEVAISGWVQTSPANNACREITLGINEDSTGNDFGNTKSYDLSGYKFHDQNENGVLNTPEPKLADWTIKATPLNGAEDDSRVEKIVATNGTGTYVLQFTAADLGNWRISEEQQEGWVQTAPHFEDQDYYVVTVASDGLHNGYELANDEFHFGNNRIPTSTNQTIVVRYGDLASNFASVSADPSKWLFYNDETDTIDNTLGSFIFGSGTPVHGYGSAEITVSGTQRRNLATYGFFGTKLADISQLKFRTYNPSAGNGGSADRSAYLNFNVDFYGSDTWQKRLVYVPRINASVSQDAWQEWDAINSGNALWSWSGYASFGNKWPDGELMEYRTWNSILAAFPNVAVRTTDSWFGMRVGEPYADGYTENIDSLTIGIHDPVMNNTSTTVYDFEPTAVCYDGVDNDQDGLVDLADAGCADPTDGDETNPIVPTPTPTSTPTSGGGGGGVGEPITTPTPSATPTPSSTPTPAATPSVAGEETRGVTGGGTTGGGNGGQNGGTNGGGSVSGAEDTNSPSPSPSASTQPQTASIAGASDAALCSPAAAKVFWLSLVSFLILIVFFMWPAAGVAFSVSKLLYALAPLAGVFAVWAKTCMWGFWWIPVVLSVLVFGILRAAAMALQNR